MGFLDSSVGKESACNGGDPGSIPGPGRSAGEGNGNPLQHSCLTRAISQRRVKTLTGKMSNAIPTFPPDNSCPMWNRPELRKGRRYTE